MSLIYEVNIDIDAELAAEYRAWLGEHVAEILALPGFSGADVFLVDEPPPGRVGYCIQYRLSDRAALDAYLREHAPRLRAEGIARWGERFSARRRILQPA